jgi:type I restriction enzyme S subunit
MSSTKIKLKEVISEFVVPMRDKPKIFGGSIPWCRIEDIDGKYLCGTKSNKYVSNETIKSMNLKILPINSVLFTCSATIGVVSINKTELCTNQTFIGLITNEKIDYEYLYYYLSLCKDRFKKLASITTIPYISRKQFEEFEIDIFNVKTQKSIASILSLLDSKIELNNLINSELEEMAKILYNYWFVQFDFPNIKDKPYKSSGGEMLWNEELKREVPKGWVVDSIEKCCSIIDCLHSKKSDYKFQNEKYYLLQLENIKDDGLLDLTNKYFVSKEEYKKWTYRIEVSENDILITNAGRVAATAQIPSFVKAGIGRNITAIRPVNINPTYLFLSFRGADLERQIRSNTDSGAFFSSLNVKGIKKLLIVRPPIKIENQFEKIARPIRDKRELNNTENQKLTQLRDWLLPMLMNGQVQVG